MAINDSAVVPLYQQVKDDIRAAIESGKYILFTIQQLEL